MMLKTTLLLALMIDLMWSCCIPKQNEVNIELLVLDTGKGNPKETTLKGFSQTHSRIHYDAVNMKIAAVTDEYIKTIQDFKNETVYYIDLRTKSCIVSPRRQSFPSICTDRWTKIGSLYYGDGALLAGKYMCSQGKGHHMNATMSESKCIPVLWQNILDNDGDDDGGMMMIHVFSNLTEGIKDPTVFDPPPYCNKTTIATEEWGIIDHFIHLAGKCFPIS